MADQDCEYCHRHSSCRFAYQETDCKRTQIEEAKSIVNEEFEESYRKYKRTNEVACNERLSRIVSAMEELILESKETLD